MFDSPLKQASLLTTVLLEHITLLASCPFDISLSSICLCRVCASGALIQSHSLRQSLLFCLSCYNSTASCCLQVHWRSVSVLTWLLLLSVLFRRSFYTYWSVAWPLMQLCSAWRAHTDNEGGRAVFAYKDHHVLAAHNWVSDITGPLNRICVYPWPAAMDDVIRRLIDLALHLNWLLLVVCHFDPENPKIWTSKVQSDEVPLFCQNKMKSY